MKMLSYNIRGVGRKAKKKEIRELVNNWKVDACFIQESKLEKVDGKICRRLWGKGNFGWAFKQAEGRAGGLISIWNEEKFISTSSWDALGILVVNGIWKEDGKRCTFVNIHAPNIARQRWALWDTLSALADQCKDDYFAIMGDFNAIKDPRERVGRRGQEDKRDIEKFREFIEANDLIDIRLSGKNSHGTGPMAPVKANWTGCWSTRSGATNGQCKS
ncbi:hypothetical protein ACS0TY_020372 [Phlomoides rotata]